MVKLFPQVAEGKKLTGWQLVLNQVLKTRRSVSKFLKRITTPYTEHPDYLAKVCTFVSQFLDLILFFDHLGTVSSGYFTDLRESLS